MTKKIKQMISALLVLSTCSVALFSCGSESSGDTTQKADINKAPTGDISISSDYTIIYDKKINSQATRLRKSIYDVCGKTPKFTADSSIQSDYEILIGDTGRQESTDFINSLRDYTYGIKICNDSEKIKILIGAKKQSYYALAVELFTKEYLPEDKTDLRLRKTEETIMINEEDKLQDEILAAQPINWEGNNILIDKGGYGRMCLLPDGKLAFVYSGGGYIRFKTSGDDGKTWSEPTNVIKLDKCPTGQTMTTANANIVVMKDGSYMVAFRAHTAGSQFDTFYSSIRYCISSDGGKTWSADTIVAENTHIGTEFTGFWEPHMLYIKDGKLAMYYASDCIGGDAADYPFVKSMNYQHIILHLYDEATGRFGEPIIASNGEDHNSRDGMPVVSKLSDGTYAMVIESSSMKGTYPFIIQILFSEDGIKWSEPKNIWVPVGFDHYAGAPYLVTLPDGRIAVSFQATEGSESTLADNKVNNSVMNVIISKNPVTYTDKDSIKQANFERVYFNPIQTQESNSFSIWPAMFVHNNKLYCTADLGYSTSKTARTTKGIYLRIGNIK